MVASIRDIGNKIFSNSANIISDSRMTLPNSKKMNIDDFHDRSIDNYNDVRECMIYSNKTSSRTVLMSSSEALVNYATKMEQLNNLPNNKETREPIDSSQLSYIASGEQGNQVSKVANSSSSRKQQYVINEDLALNRATNLNKYMFNMQLSYDVN